MGPGAAAGAAPAPAPAAAAPRRRKQRAEPPADPAAGPGEPPPKRAKKKRDADEAAEAAARRLRATFARHVGRELDGPPAPRPRPLRRLGGPGSALGGAAAGGSAAAIYGDERAAALLAGKLRATGGGAAPSVRLKERLAAGWATGTRDAAAQDFLTACHEYCDVLHANRPLAREAGEEAADGVLAAYLGHCLDHVLKSADVIRGNNLRARDLEDGGADVRDQGFTRPKVLLLYPFRKFALQAALALADYVVSGAEPARAKLRRSKGGEAFLEQFEAAGGGEDGAAGAEAEGAAATSSGGARPSRKPPEFQQLFRGNVDDHFKLGIKVTKNSVRLLTDFYGSDIIVASPLGLVTYMNDLDRENAADFLSSIEIFVVDRADVLAMQNWDHVLSVADYLNRIPTEQHGVDIMRVRPWYLSGLGRHYRQNLVLAAHPSPDFNSLFSTKCLNFEGKVKIQELSPGVVGRFKAPVKQLYQRLDAADAADADDARFEHFKSKLLPRLRDSASKGILVFARTYFEFVRVRNLLQDELASYLPLSEYEERREADRTRSAFAKGHAKFLLYSERAHFYHRYKIRGIKDIVVYSLPDHNEFLAELVNMVGDDHVANASVTVLFNRFDAIQLGRAVGTKRAKEMLRAEASSFLLK